MAVRGKSEHSGDVDRLFEAAGINPSAYVQFERSKARASSPAKKQTGDTGAPRPVKRAAAVPVPGAVAKHAEANVTPAAQASPAPAAGGLFSWVERISRTPRVHKPIHILLMSSGPETGKTTLASALAGLFVHRGQPALLIDHSANNGASNLLGGSEEHFGAVSFGTEGASRRSFPLLSEYWKGVPCDDFAAWRDLLTTRARITLLDGVDDSVAAAQQLLQSGGRVLIPVLPTMMSAIDAVRLDDALDGRHSTHLHFVLNRYDGSQPLHREVRSGLKVHLGDRLLPIEIEEDRLLHEAACSGRFQDEEALASRAICSLRQLADWLELESLGIAGGEMEEEQS
jgi:hypothetical protein